MKHSLLSTEGLHLVALSGGADSVSLLRILHALNYQIEAVHCNFHLRGTESNRDEEFVKLLCNKLNIKLHLIHFDTKEYAEIHQLSIEMAARELRYRYFDQLRQDIGADSVCVAHHRNDNVETLLMNLMRGSGIHGLTGIRSKNGYIVRPLLCVSRQEIEEYLDSIGQDYVTDSTNLAADVLRNRLRLKVLPLLNKINPGAVENINRSTQYLAEAEHVYTEAIRHDIERLVSYTTEGDKRVAKADLKELPSVECFMHEWLNGNGFNRTQIAQIVACIDDSEAGSEFTSSTHSLVTTHQYLILAPQVKYIKPLRIPEPGRYAFEEGRAIDIKETEDITISKTNDCATLDASKVQFPLMLRHIQSGDRFHPFGMTGSKLLSDYLTDLHVSLHEKRRQLVVVDATGQIIWVVGKRTCHYQRITADTTRVLRLTIIDQNWHYDK